MKKLTVLLTLFALLCTSFVAADVIGEVTVTWTNVAGNYYSGVICVEDISIFGGFQEILAQYSYSDHTNPPSPNSVSLTDQGNDRYCGDLTPGLWDSTPTADTLAGAKITVKHTSCNAGLCFQDDPWSTDTNSNVDDLNHLFRWIGETPDCTDIDGDNYNASYPGCGPADCDDSESTMFPGNPETCDGLDNDCNDIIDEGGNLCTAYNNPVIATCTNDPDDIDETWDYYAGFTSVCQSGACTTEVPSFTHDCDSSGCGAECEIDNDCDDKCEGQIFNYNGDCGSACTCSFTTEDCDLQDGWYDTGSTQWIEDLICTEKEQKEQEDRDYSCVSTSGCEYTASSTRWVDTGSTRNKADNTDCGVLKLCSSGQCIDIDCEQNSDCGTDTFVGNEYCQDIYTVVQDYRTFTCNSPSTVSASCSDSDAPTWKEDCDATEDCISGDCIYIPQIDLWVEEARVTPANEPKAGKMTTVRFILSNAGVDPITNIEYIVDTGSPDTNPSATISSLGGSSTIKPRASWIYANPGTYNAKVIIDPDNKIREISETNNEFLFNVTVRAKNNPRVAISLPNAIAINPTPISGTVNQVIVVGPTIPAIAINPTPISVIATPVARPAVSAFAVSPRIVIVTAN